MKALNIGLIGYGFMGRAHSNAFCKAPHFFDLPFAPVLKAVCARDAAKVAAFAGKWGYESVETDWRKLIARADYPLCSWIDGSVISAIDVRGPDAMRRMSFAIFASDTAIVFNCPEASTQPSLVPCASKCSIAS